ncbi:MAG: hypothetical protein M1814_001722 [Vezdaea aestivalis]|nr:MAG: hypothetical protein M1814_001722 [Vezdaea aestivalis]
MVVSPSTNGLQSAKDSTLPNTSRPSTKAAATPKSIDLSRKLAGSPAADSGLNQNKRASVQQKAWTSGSNPITRAAQQQQPQQLNGSIKPPGQKLKAAEEQERHAHDRMVYLFGNLMGLHAAITVLNGDKYEGIFSGSSIESSESVYLLQMVRKIKAVAGQNGNVDSPMTYIGEGENHTMSFNVKDVVDFSAANVTLDAENTSKSQNGASFLTDSDISGNRNARERPLQKWEPDPDMDMSLEGDSNKSSLGWDQFETNRRLFGAKSNYDESYYTTTINTSHPMHKQRVADAERLAKEIEREGSGNAHVREERGLKGRDDSGLDEEERYSGVRRSAQDFPPLQSGTNKYTPPARRPPTGQPTVRGAPVDPAIISSQIARTDGSSARREKDGKQKQQGADSGTVKEKEQPAAPERPEAEQTSTKKPDAIKPSKVKDTSKGKTPAPITVESHTANVESEVRDAFRDFAKFEKMRVANQRRHQARTDKDIKLNDLMKFSQTFKLHTPVPKDLLSILARDPTKQEQIVENANRNAAETETAGPSTKKQLTTHNEEKSYRKDVHKAADIQSYNKKSRENTTSQVAHHGQPQQRNDRSGQTLPSRPAPGPGLSQRLAKFQGQGRGVTLLSLQDARVPPTGPSGMPSDFSVSQRSSGAPTPLSATSGRFNAAAIEFRPNPAASNFTPNREPSAQSSPRLGGHNAGAQHRPASRQATPADFWGAKKPNSARPDIDDYFNPFKRLKKEYKEAREGKESKDENGGIPWAHRTLPRWDSSENVEKTYINAFNELPTLAQGHSNNPSMTNSHQPHHHQQIPYHPGNQVASHSQHVPHHLHPNQQPHHSGMQQQFDDHRMQYSQSTSGVYPSPRMPQANVPYQQSPMPPNAQLAYQQPMQYGPSGGIQMTAMRSYSGGPHHMPAPNGAQMMVHNPSNGPYPNMPQAIGGPFNQQMPMYGSPAQAHVHPYVAGPPSMGPGHNGYPSPGRGAPPMMHQGSQQGQPQNMMMYGMNQGPHHQPMYSNQPSYVPNNMRGGYMPQYQGHYAPSPQQQHYHPMQLRGSSQGGYNPQHHPNGHPQSYNGHPAHNQDPDAEGK